MDETEKILVDPQHIDRVSRNPQEPTCSQQLQSRRPTGKRGRASAGWYFQVATGHWHSGIQWIFNMTQGESLVNITFFGGV